MRHCNFLFALVFVFCSGIIIPQQSSTGLQGTHKNAFTNVRPPSIYTDRAKLNKTATATFLIHYNSPAPPPQAQAAIQAAVDIWKYLINTAVSQTITIDVIWKDLGYSSNANFTLANCGATSFYNSSSLPHSGVQYPIALAEYLLDQNLNTNNYEMLININSHDSVNWYYGTDGVPQSGKPDLVSTVLHEIAHGLGYSSFFRTSGNLGYKGKGSYPVDVNSHYSIYDMFGAIGSYYPNTDLLIYDNDASTKLKNDLTSNNVYFSGDNAWIQNGRYILPKLYVPSGWNDGSSFTHLDDATYPAGNSNSLMTHSMDNAEVIHSPGEVGLAILQDLGWTINRLATFTNPQPGGTLQKGIVDTLLWTDNKGGAYNLLLLDSLDNYIMNLPYQNIAVVGLNYYTWNVPTSLANGKYRIKIEEFAGSGIGITNIFTITNQQQVAKPSFSPKPGHYQDPVTVSASSTQGATIRYTIDGTMPTTSSPIFPSSLLISTLTTIRAKAYKSGLLESDTTIATYSIGTTPPVPDITPINGTYVQNLISTISWPSGLRCFMNSTTDGSTPYDPSLQGHQFELINNPWNNTWPYTGTVKMRARTLLNDTVWSDMIEREYIIVNGVIIKQLDASSNSFGQAAYWANNQWNYVDPGEAQALEKNKNYFLSTQEFKPSTYQKFNNWLESPNNYNRYRNWDTLTIFPNTNEVSSHFTSSYSGITIKNNLELSSSTDGYIQFKDPWLVDVNDQPYGQRSNGLDATFKQRSSPFFPDYSTSYSGNVYKGIFLNQSGGPSWAPPYYSVQAISPQTIHLSADNKDHDFYFQNWDGTNITYQYPNSAQTPVVFTSSNATATANMKGTQLSNQTDALAGNGQKKIVKTSDGYLHQVYESLNKVWYERSTDNGTTWEIMNGGQAVSAGTAKQPSIDFWNTTNGPVIAIAYQSYTSSSANVNLAIFKDGTLQSSVYGFGVYSVSSGDQANFNTRPVISINPDGKILVVWYVDGEIAPPAGTGLNYKYGYLYLYNGTTWMINWYTPSAVVMGGTSYLNLGSPALDTYKSAVQPFQLAYERSNTIYYNTLTDNSNYTNHIQEGSVQNISSGGGYTFNNNPSLIAVNGGARVVWEGKNSSANRNVVFHDPGYYYFWSFNSTGGYYDCLSPNINRPDNYSAYFFGWSENNNGYVLNNSLSYINIKYLGINGQYMQLNNGATPGAMYATTLNTSGSPYYFTKSSSSIGSLYGLSKDANSFAGIEGRKGVVFKDSAQFYFDINKIKVDGQDIKFVEIYKEENITNIESLNKYLISEPFTLSSKSEFTYNVNYGVTDTASGNAVLGENDFISFKLQLIEDKTGKVIGEFDDVKYTKNNLFEYKNVDYQVDANGVGNKSVRLKLIVNNNFESGYALSMSNTGDGTDRLSKESYKQISYNQNNVVTSYDLAQNYPNPFNPTTIIKYQLPKEGYVTLKIYDILGREIVTLVDEFKTQGSYNVTFNANNLASGIYIYQLRANDFVSNKKLILMK